MVARTFDLRMSEKGLYVLWVPFLTFVSEANLPHCFTVCIRKFKLQIHKLKVCKNQMFKDGMIMFCPELDPWPELDPFNSGHPKLDPNLQIGPSWTSNFIYPELNPHKRSEPNQAEWRPFFIYVFENWTFMENMCHWDRSFWLKIRSCIALPSVAFDILWYNFYSVFEKNFRANRKSIFTDVKL